MGNELVERALRFREGGHVERAHTVPHHGSYSVATHSWHAAGLLLALHPDPSVALIKAVLLHDVQERWTGDMPRHTGRLFLDMRADFRAATVVAQMVLGIAIDLTAEERQWLHAIDGLEFLLWCYDQEALGNKHVSGYKANQWKWFLERPTELPKPVKEFLKAYHWKRTDDIITEEKDDGDARPERSAGNRHRGQKNRNHRDADGQIPGAKEGAVRSCQRRPSRLPGRARPE